MSTTTASKPYAPDNGYTMNGLLLLTTALILAGSAMGYVAHHIARHFWLILLFPFLLGFALGWVGTKMVVQGKVRNPWIGGLAGLLGGLFAMLVMHHSTYTHDRSEAMKSPAMKQLMELPAEQREALLAGSDDPEAVDAIRAIQSFPAYMDFNARQGVSIGRRSSSAINLGYVGTWIYWVVEVAIVAGVTFAMIRKQTLEPFCAGCENWKTKQTLGPVGNPDVARSAVVSGDLRALAGCQPNAESDCVLAAHVCSKCQGQKSDIDLLLSRFTTGQKGDLVETKLVHHSWPGHTLAQVLGTFAATPQTNAPDDSTTQPTDNPDHPSTSA